MGTGKKIEGYWDCPQCGSKKIKGRFRYCNSCGRPRGKGVQFYMIETDNYVDDSNQISSEPDWYCSFCQSLNPATSTTCESCGSSQEDSDMNYFQLLEDEKRKKQTEQEAKSMTEELNDVDEFVNPIIDQNVQSEGKKYSQNDNISTIEQYDDTRKRSFNFGWIAKLGAMFLPIVLVFALLFNFILPKEISLTVTNKTWERSIEIEEYKTVREDGWSVPNGGRVVYTKEEVHHYNRVLDHYETVTEQKSERYISHYETVVTGHRDLGNGYFEEITSQKPVYDTRYWTETKEEPVYRQEPVEQTKYYYDIEKWVHKCYEKTSGNDEKPYWATLNLIPEREKEGTRSEVYTIFTENKKGKTKSYKIPFDDWSQIRSGNIIKVKISAGSISEIISIN